MSAALQTPTGLPTSARHYTPSHSSPTRDGQHARQQQQLQQQQQQQGSTASLTPSGRPSRKNSATNGGAYSPVDLSNAVSAAASMSQPSPSASSERRRHVPPVAPPRTSSNRYEQQQQPQLQSQSQQQLQQLQQQQLQQHQPATPTAPASGSSSRRSAAAADSPRRHRESRGTPSGSGGARDDSAHRRQQRTQPSADEYARKATGSRSTSTTMPIRSAPSATSGTSGASASSHGPVRESSEILNTMVVSQDEVDIERERARIALAQEAEEAAPPPVVPTSANMTPEHAVEPHRGTRSRHDHSKREKQIKFGEYILGNTIGEGEFGKVKLGWKQEGGVQVAIKLIKKDTLGNNPTRMAKIMREVNILRQLNHPNIVQLHKMEESEHHYGIVLEYASGGELFDYILNHRYLKDHSARRLFAQLISGVGYLHKKGIVHRDLKLENLLLDRNRNIIITDFGFANTFEPNEELTEDEEANLSDREYVRRMGFDWVKPNGMRKADLMQTSCGSPCYAAPELVVSDSLYTGRKVDVWSCGVILYAMLAGYLPFDDDPKNPEGDNINLLYKYIVNTPLTFPEYVTPHSRDLLRRILVPDPRQRADLFEVARHSWLSEYAHVVEFITSSTTSPSDIQNIPLNSEELAESSMHRSASVREASKKAPVSQAIGGLTSKQGTIDPESEAAIVKQQKDNKRRTVQVEYVAPTTQTQRGEAPTQASGSKTRVRPITGPVAVSTQPTAAPASKPLPRDPPVAKDIYPKPSRESRRPPSAHRNTSSSAGVMQGATPSRSNRTMEAAYMTSGVNSRPVTGGSMTSTGSRTAPHRASFGQPVPPAVAGTNVHGRIQQPSSGSARNYITNPQDASSFGRPSISLPQKAGQVLESTGYPVRQSRPMSMGPGEARGHRRSNTLGDITDKLLGRSGSIFGKNRKRPEQRQSMTGEKASRRYPPVSMSNTVAALQNVQADEPRPSIDSTTRQSRRSLTLGLGKKRSGSIADSQTSQDKPQSRRFSLLPGSFSLKSIGLSKDDDRSPTGQADLPQDLSAGSGLSEQENLHAGSYDNRYEPRPDPQRQQVPRQYQQQQQQQQLQQQQQFVRQRYGNEENYEHPQSSSGQYYGQTGGALQEMADNVQRNPPKSAPYPADMSDSRQSQDLSRRAASRGGRVVLQKNNKRFMDAYETDEFAKHHDRSGSSGAARRVMDFFRRRGKARGGDD